MPVRLARGTRAIKALHHWGALSDTNNFVGGVKAPRLQNHLTMTVHEWSRMADFQNTCLGKIVYGQISVN